MRKTRTSALRIGAVGLSLLGAAMAFGAPATPVAPAGDTYRVIKRIPIPGDTGWDYITADSEGRRLYVPHGTEVVVMDLDSGAMVGKIAGLKGVHGVAIAREFGRGFISTADPGSVTIFYLKTPAGIY